MPEKKCFKCLKIKPLSEFYVHPRMADGHLNKCKQCTVNDSEARRKIKELDPDWAEAEKQRHKLKSQKALIDGKVKIYNHRSRLRKKGLPTDLDFRTRRTPEENAFRKEVADIANEAARKGIIPKLDCEVCGKGRAHGHHEDYSKPLEVQWLCPKHHSARHVHLWDHELMGKPPMPINEFMNLLRDSPF